MNLLSDNIVIDEADDEIANLKRDPETGRLLEDKYANVRFTIKAVKNKIESEKQGRPIYDEREFIMITTPGDAETVIDTLVRPEHIFRFGKEYEAWKKNEVFVAQGTPVMEWKLISVAQRAELVALNIKTVEQLSELPDTVAQRHMGMLQMKAQAAQWLKRTQQEAVESKAAETAERIEALEVERNQAVIEAQATQAQLAEMMKELAEMRKQIAKQNKPKGDSAPVAE